MLTDLLSDSDSARTLVNFTALKTGSLRQYSELYKFSSSRYIRLALVRTKPLGGSGGKLIPL